MTDWWSQRLSNSPSPKVSSSPPVTPPMRGAIRIPQPQSAPAVTNQRSLEDTSDPNKEINMGTAIRSWKGGEAHRTDQHSCPSCGSNLVFSRAKSGRVNGHSPAPRCYECGWNGLYDQGDQISWA